MDQKQCPIKINSISKSKRDDIAPQHVKGKKKPKAKRHVRTTPSFTDAPHLNPSRPPPNLPNSLPPKPLHHPTKPSCPPPALNFLIIRWWYNANHIELTFFYSSIQYFLNVHSVQWLHNNCFVSLNTAALLISNWIPQKTVLPCCSWNSKKHQPTNKCKTN